jgi:hypothetical protein
MRRRLAELSEARRVVANRVGRRLGVATPTI